MTRTAVKRRSDVPRVYCTMHHQLTALFLASTAAGCSVLFNPNNIPVPAPDADDALPDAYVADADPTRLEIDDLGPHVLFEGQGTGGSRAAILTLIGHHFVEGVQVRLIAPGGEPVMFVVDNLNVVLAPGRDVLAVPITLPVDVGRGAAVVPMTVEVTQGAVTKRVEGKLEIHNLNELGDSALTESTDLDALYSRIDHPTLITFSVTPNKPPAQFRAVSSIVLGDVTANATGATAGPGGSVGGASGAPGAGTGAGQPGNATGGGGGAGSVTAGGDGSGTGGAGGPQIGEPLIKGYGTNHGSGGGGGTGSVGGGGGGTIEITAGGTVKVGKIEVNGANGTAGGVSGGGGGAGGVVVIRAGVSVQLTGAITANPGVGSPGTGIAGGAGRSGRIRLDAPLVIGAPLITPPPHSGMSLDPTSPRSTRNFMQPIVSYGTRPGSAARSPRRPSARRRSRSIRRCRRATTASASRRTTTSPWQRPRTASISRTCRDRAIEPGLTQSCP
jgi:hypothetical protein